MFQVLLLPLLGPIPGFCLLFTPCLLHRFHYKGTALASLSNERSLNKKQKTKRARGTEQLQENKSGTLNPHPASTATRFVDSEANLLRIFSTRVSKYDAKMQLQQSPILFSILEYLPFAHECPANRSLSVSDS